MTSSLSGNHRMVRLKIFDVLNWKVHLNGVERNFLDRLLRTFNLVCKNLERLMREFLWKGLAGDEVS